jgi:hypothetical protein
MTTPFDLACESAIQHATERAEPWVVTRAELEAALQPIVDSLLAMTPDEAIDHMLATWNYEGNQRAGVVLALSMYKQQKP